MFLFILYFCSTLSEGIHIDVIDSCHTWHNHSQVDLLFKDMGHTVKNPVVKNSGTFCSEKATGLFEYRV